MGGGLVRGRKISKRARRELRACWEIWKKLVQIFSGDESRRRGLTFDHALNTTGNHGLEYRMAQNTMVTRIGKVTTVV